MKLRYNDFLKSILVVTRCSGERTALKLIIDLAEFLPPENIRVVTGIPAAITFMNTYRVASESDLPYLLALDGDITIKTDTFQILYKNYLKFDGDKTLRMVCSVDDKFKGTRIAGNHFFYNKWSKQIYEYMKTEGDMTKSRPESGNIDKFAKKMGLSPVSFRKANLALHDYYQFYRRIFNSQRNLALKSQDKQKLYDECRKRLYSYPTMDWDLRIALEGVKYAMSEKRSDITLNVVKFIDISDILASIGLVEKDYLIPDLSKYIDWRI